MTYAESREAMVESLDKDWTSNHRWTGVERGYTAADVVRLRGSIMLDYTLAQRGSRRFWELLQSEPFTASLGTMTGLQAVQQVKAGLKAVYVSGWQAAGDANSSGQTFPDQSLYPVDSVPNLVRRVNSALVRADQIQWTSGHQATQAIDYFVPVIADGESGFGGTLNAYELMKSMIEAGAAAVHFEDQLSSRKCAGFGGKVMVPTREACDTLIAARLAADVMGVPTVLIARTDALLADTVTTDADPEDRRFCTGERTVEGFFKLKDPIERTLARGEAVARYADVVWCEAGKPDLAFAKTFAEAIHAKYPGKPLAYNCTAGFDWKGGFDDRAIAGFQDELAALGYRFQFITLAGFHSVNVGMFNLAYEFAREQMTAYARLQQIEFAAIPKGFSAVRHHEEVGSGYFDAVTNAIQSRYAAA
jgi:isocitrate lyase